MAIIPKIYNDAVVAIGCRESGELKWLATGFVVARKNENGGYNTFVVTNRHVLDDDCKELIFRFNIHGKIKAKDYPIITKKDNDEKLFSVHSDPNVDVACMMLNAKILANDLGGISAFALDTMSLNYNEMIDNEIIEGALVYTLGFPSGIVGLNSKMPLCRLGCISRITEKYGNEGYLLDIQNFPGSSGSPVINKLENNFLEGTKCYNSTKLIGIISAYLPYKDYLYSQQTGELVQITQENSGIAKVYTVDAIKATVELEVERVKQKEKVVQANKVDPIVENK